MALSIVRGLAISFLMLASGFVVAQADAGKTLEKTPAGAEDTRTLEQKACYLIGYNMGRQLTSQGLNVDVDQLFIGIKHALANEKLAMSPEEAQKVMVEFANEMQAKEEQKLEELSLKNTKEGEAYLKANAAKEGVIKLDSGVQYRVLKEGAEGAAKPTAESVVKVHYAGRLTDGVEFDTSAGGEPAEFAVSGVIRGMTEALQKMKVGDKIELVIPSDLGYGPNGSMPVIGPNAVLIFELELIEIVK
ncbi:MAG: FKBP-type peptidyl-prolyl cis-trans isomerase [Pirellulaceae bacterium]